MKKYISFILAFLFCFACSVTALAETVVLAPESVSDPDVKTSILVQGGPGFWSWFFIILAAIVVVFAVIIFINKKRDKKKQENQEK